MLREGSAAMQVYKAVTELRLNRPVEIAEKTGIPLQSVYVALSGLRRRNLIPSGAKQKVLDIETAAVQELRVVTCPRCRVTIQVLNGQEVAAE